MRTLVLILIKAYRLLISPWLGNHCRFQPTCSQYAITAVERFGVVSGLWLAFRRIGRCHPWHAGGIDPVPPTHIEQQSSKQPHG